MTLVVTTVSRNGITVVADRAVSRRVDGDLSVLASPVEKLIYSEAANIAFACWGNTEFTEGTDYFEWLSAFADSQVKSGTSLLDAAEQLAQMLNGCLRPIAARHHGWAKLRRGIHVSGYVGDLPCIYHVHTGDPRDANHPLRVHKDFPDIHAGGADQHRRNLDQGHLAQLFNGFHELFGILGESLAPLRRRLEEEFGVEIPAATLQGQLEFDLTLVRLAAGLLRAADRAPQVSIETTQVVFTRDGLVELPSFSPDLPPFGSASQSAPTASPNVSMSPSAWDNGHHTDVRGDEPAT